MRRDWHALLVGIAVSLGAAPAAALTPEEVFTRVSPSVWFVYGADDTDRRLTQGSGVVVAPQRVITNCHVLENASTVFVRKENVIYIAKVEFRDARRDLCQLQVPNFTAPAVELGSSRELRVGQKVYALGNPKGLEVTLSDGLVSALRGPDGVEPIVQTTAPISPGSSGGGLFDDRGRLVGVTTLQRRDGQNLNFALPAEWVAELPQRVKLAAEEATLARKLKDEQLARLRERGVLYNPASERLPAVGETWRYRYSDVKYSRVQEEYSVRVGGVDGWGVTESYSVAQGGAAGQQNLVRADELRFQIRPLNPSRTLVEFAPYFLARDAAPLNYLPLDRAAGYPEVRSLGGDWRVVMRTVNDVDAVTPAKTYRGVKVEVEGRRTPTSDIARRAGEPGHFLLTVWYAPEVKRYVRIEHRVWNADNGLMSEERVELLQHTGG